MNVSIKPLLISTSSPQMASSIYPFPRILAVHLKYAAANTSWKRPRIAKGTWVFLLLYLTLLPGRIRLITCPLRWPDMIMITPQACLEKPEHATASFGSPFFFFFLPVSGYSSSPQWEQKLMLQYTDTTAGKASHTQVLFFKGFSLLLEKLVTSWSFDEMPCATWATQKYVVIIVVGSLHFIQTR